MATIYDLMWRLSVTVLISMLLCTSCVAFNSSNSQIHPRNKTPLITLKWSNNDESNNDWNLFKRRPAYQASNLQENIANRNRPSSSSYEGEYQQRNGETNSDRSYITLEMEQEVMATARANIDDKTVSRAISSLVSDDSDGSEKRRDGSINSKSTMYNIVDKKTNKLRDLAGNIGPSPMNEAKPTISQDTSNNSWDSQQIAIASGITTCLLSPIIIPIIHSLIPPIFPFPASLSFEEAALLGALAYILALGDPTDQSNFISKSASGGMLGDGVEVTGAVSRIVGRTALQSVKTSAPRIKAVARAVVDYDSTVNTMEEMKEIQYQLSSRLLEVESENDELRREVALWTAVEDIAGDYKLEELKEIAKFNGIRGYSSDGKTALLRRLVRERALDLDLTPYYRAIEEAR